MTYKTGSWGPQAKERAKKRVEWFFEYNRKRDPIKRGARRKVQYALKVGKLSKKPCEVCGSKKVQAHHDDYKKPLDVRWFCAKHHREADSIARHQGQQQ